MKDNKFKYVITALVLIFFSTSVYSFVNEDSSFKEKIEYARSNNKKVIIDFYTDWCGWCKKMDKDTYENNDVKSLIKKGYILLKVNAESNEIIEFDGKKFTKSQFAKAFGVTGYPATAFLDNESKPITLVPGYLDSKTFVKILSFIGDDVYKTKKTFAEFEKEFDSKTK